MTAGDVAMQDAGEIAVQVLADPTKPVGDACNSDGTLKEADEMEWLHSPSSRPASLPPASEPVSAAVTENETSDAESVPIKRKVSSAY